MVGCVVEYSRLTIYKTSKYSTVDKIYSFRLPHFYETTQLLFYDSLWCWFCDCIHNIPSGSYRNWISDLSMYPPIPGEFPSQKNYLWTVPNPVTFYSYFVYKQLTCLFTYLRFHVTTDRNPSTESSLRVSEYRSNPLSFTERLLKEL